MRFGLFVSNQGVLQQIRTSHLVVAVYEFKDPYTFKDGDLETVSDFFFRAEIYFKIVIIKQQTIPSIEGIFIITITLQCRYYVISTCSVR